MKQTFSKIVCTISAIMGFLLPPDLRATIGSEQLRASIAKGLPLIERAAAVSLKERACYTCHNGASAVIAMNAAFERGFHIDRQVMADVLARSHTGMARHMRSDARGGRVPGQSDEVGWVMVSFKQLGWRDDSLANQMADFLTAYKKEQPYWQFTGKRLPTVGGAFTSTFVALDGIKAYAAENELSVARIDGARDWLLNNGSYDTEDQVYRLRSLALLEESEAADLEAFKLIGGQRSDGGWAQLPELDSDPYATSTALSALIDTGYLSADERWAQSGLSYLLKTQKADGSWQVKKRARVVQPFYDSGYPHGEDQFISAVAASWAVYVMAKVLPESGPNYQKPYLTTYPDVQTQIIANGSAPQAKMPDDQRVFFEQKVLPVLESKCYSCHSKDAKKLKADLYLDSRDGVLLGGENGPAIVPGDPALSLLIMALKGESELSEMPPKEPLPQSVIANLEQWIAMGAPDPREALSRPTVEPGLAPSEGRSAGGFRRRGNVGARGAQGRGRTGGSLRTPRQQEWTDVKGGKFTAALMRIQGDVAVIQTESGEARQIPIASFSEESQQRIFERQRRVRSGGRFQGRPGR